MRYSEPEEIAGTTGSDDLGKFDSIQAITSEHAKLNTDYNEYQARAGGGGVLEHLPLCPKCPFVKAILLFFLLNTLKETTAGVVPKARLVAKGFEETQDLHKDSPTWRDGHKYIKMYVK